MSRVVWVLMLVGAAGCGDPGVVTLSGAFQKGPFVVGSSLGISPVDAEGNPSGLVFNTQTLNDRGEFSVDFAYTGLISLEGEGFYYNEVTGELSAAPGTLRGYYEVSTSGTQAAFVNIVTHLAHRRATKLLRAGMVPSAAIAQAEAELRAALRVGPAGFDPMAGGNEMDLLGGDTDANAYLFAVSAVVIRAAIERGGPLEAAFQELSNLIQADLADDGLLEESITTALLAAQYALDPGLVMSLLATRLAAIGSTAAVPDLDRMIDSDADGTVNASDNCRDLPNADQADADSDGHGDLCSPAEILVYLGDDQSRPPGTVLFPFVVRVVDPLMSIVAGAEIEFVVTSGGGTLSVATATTDDQGLAQSVLTLGAVVDDVTTVEARFPGLPPAIFTARATDAFLGFQAAFELAHDGGCGPFGQCVVATDLNSDGKLDLVVGEYNSPMGETARVIVLINTTPGGATTPSFAPSASLSIASVEDGYGNLAIADVNADARPDLVLSFAPNNRISVFLNETAPGAPAATFAPRADFLGGNQLAIGDLNGDGMPDLASAASGSNAIRILVNTTPVGATTATFAGPVSIADASAFSITIGDINGDDRLDLVVAKNTVPSVHLNDTPAGAMTPSFLPAVPCCSTAENVQIQLVDLNHDARPDLARLTTIQTPDPAVFGITFNVNTTPAGATTPSFGPDSLISNEYYGYNFGIGDIDRDGYPDIGFNVYSYREEVRFNATAEGAAQVSYPSSGLSFPISNFQAPSAPVFADLNGDDKVDLIYDHFGILKIHLAM